MDVQFSSMAGVVIVYLHDNTFTWIVGCKRMAFWFCATFWKNECHILGTSTLVKVQAKEISPYKTPVGVV